MHAKRSKGTESPKMPAVQRQDCISSGNSLSKPRSRQKKVAKEREIGEDYIVDLPLPKREKLSSEKRVEKSPA